MNEISHKKSRSKSKEKDLLETTKIESKKYKIYLKTNKINSYIIISICPKNQSNEIYQKKFVDFSLVDNFFIIFQRNIPLLFKYLERMFKCNLYNITNNKTNLVLTLFCLQENRDKFIYITLYNNNPHLYNKMKDIKNINISIEICRNTENSVNGRDNLFPAPISMDKKYLFIPNEQNNFFYYKIKNKNLIYNIYLNKKEYNNGDYKEIIIKIIENENDNDKGKTYYAYLNLVDFYLISETYFNLFNYSIDDIYDDILIILYNHNYKIEKIFDKVKLFLKIFNKSTTHNYSDIMVSLRQYEIERNEEELDNKIHNYVRDMIKITKNDGKDKENIINIDNLELKDDYQNENKIVIKDNNEISNNKNILNVIKEKEGSNNINFEKSENKENNKNVIFNNNELIINKNLLTLNFDEIKKELNNNIINNNNRNYDDNKIVNNNIVNNNIVNNNIVNNNINLNDNNISDNLNISLKEINENENIIVLYKNKKDVIINQKKDINDYNNISIRTENIELLNRKRYLIHENNNILIDKDILSHSLQFILDKRKKISENNTLLNDNQIILIINKIEKLIPEFRFLNLKINIKIIYEIIINSEEDNKNSEIIIKDFYEKTKNFHNLLFIIKTVDNLLFGGFSQIGFNLNNKEINNIYDPYSFNFSIDKMKIFNFIEENEFCIVCKNDRLPEFKDQLVFENNNIIYGYKIKKGIDSKANEDFESNLEYEKFEIKQIQVIRLYTF